jgi:hypothetical protein
MRMRLLIEYVDQLLVIHLDEHALGERVDEPKHGTEVPLREEFDRLPMFQSWIGREQPVVRGLRLKNARELLQDREHLEESPPSVGSWLALLRKPSCDGSRVRSDDLRDVSAVEIRALCGCAQPRSECRLRCHPVCPLLCHTRWRNQGCFLSRFINRPTSHALRDATDQQSRRPWRERH